MEKIFMKYRTLGKTGYKVSEIGYGSWALGADWGEVTEAQAFATLKAVETAKINFIDTADVYGNGRSEQIIAKFRQTTPTPFYVATKAGRRLSPHITAGYTKDNLFTFVDRSLSYLHTDCLDLLQLHCPPTQVYYTPEVFNALDKLVKLKKVRYYGVSVEKVEEAIKAMEYPNLATIQIIFNMFRQRPMETLFRQALKKQVGIIVRVPLASGLLTGKFNSKSKFPETDHRQYNRQGEYFDVGETFSGVDFAAGLQAVKKLETIKPTGYTMPQFALKWILMQKAVSTVIAGGKTPQQVLENSQTSDLPALNQSVMEQVSDIYNRHIKPQVHQRW
jgi:aryl-alcohol dehydrogenase-like predicted oxidoreductase